MELRDRVKEREPGSQQAQAKATALIIEIDRVVCGVSGGTEVRGVMVDVAALALTSGEDPLGVGIVLRSEVQKDMMPHVQSINGLCWQSHQCPIMSGQFRSNGVTRSSTKNCSPVGKMIGISTFWVIQCSSDPSSKWRRIGDIFFVGTHKQDTNIESIKQCDEPESIRAGAVESKTVGKRKEIVRESGSLKVATWRWTMGVAQLESMQPSVSAL